MRNIELPVSIDPPRTVDAVVPSGMIDEGVLAEVLGTKLRDMGNPLWVRAMYSTHMGNGVFGFQDAERAEWWLLHIDNGFHAFRVPDSEVDQVTSFKPNEADSD